jgi:hypothetical protein
VVDTTTFTEGIIDFAGDVEAIPERGQPLGELLRGDRAYIRGIFPVRDAAGRKVGGLFVLHDFTRHHDALRAGLLQTTFALIALGAAVAALLVFILRWFVFRRLAVLRASLEAHARVQGMPPSRIVELESEDELGRLEALFRRIMFPSRSRAEPDGALPSAPRERRDSSR